MTEFEIDVLREALILACTDIQAANSQYTLDQVWTHYVNLAYLNKLGDAPSNGRTDN